MFCFQFLSGWAAGQELSEVCFVRPESLMQRQGHHTHLSNITARGTGPIEHIEFIPLQRCPSNYLTLYITLFLLPNAKHPFYLTRPSLALA